MKIQGLAVMAIIIILPMSIILSSYTKNQVKTLDLQVSYDSKLTNATYDSIKVFQLNMSNSSTSDLINSKMRDINASAKTFYNSLASNFNMSGYGKDVLKEYVPALVYTMYDGYYIYSKYNNTLDVSDTLEDNAEYKNDQQLDGLKPYVYYSCRYKRGNDDFIINYSLDSYISIQGIIKGKNVNDAGYLLTGVTQGTDKYFYRGVEILNDETNLLTQNIYVNDNVKENTQGKVINVGDSNDKKAGNILNCFYEKENGVKYYYNQEKEEIFSIINDEKIIQYGKDKSSVTSNSNAQKYYKDAYEFKDRIINEYGLKDLSSGDAVDKNGNEYTEDVVKKGYKIFGELSSTGTETYIEDSNSDFNAHKLQVIRNSIETNLIAAISNYNNYSTSSVNFAMPKLSDEDWEKITTNVSMISFLQGLSIGGKVYNGYSIVPNNNNEEYVSEDSIYILGSDNEYHKLTDKSFTSSTSTNTPIAGILNTDFQRRTAQATYREDSDHIYSKTIYYYPLDNLANYSSIVNSNGNKNEQSVYDYLKDTSNNVALYNLAQKYYTALGRERYGQYRINNVVQ